MRKDFFRQGFEPLGRPVQLHGTFSQGRPLVMAGARPVAVPMARPPAQTARPYMSSRSSVPTALSGPQRPIQVYEKGDPNAPPCPVCG